ncbi:MAG: right-handed parallel beta-helix repeat-containing protein [Gammaproteobacteria bacterium]|nr:right-handed parallel beta-helix repeat-containing protein [Gammaproteobacteria bacterium]
MNSQGGKVKNCLSTGNGRLASDFGDRGGIGSYQGGNIKIIGNEVYLNGQDNQDADMEISVVGAIAPITIEKNHVHNCIQGCIQIAEGGDGSVVSYNVINGFGSAVSATPSSSGKWGGIRIGGGTGSAKNVRILNNVILGGLQPNTTSHAGIYVSQFDNPGLILKNNIFYNNASKDVFVHSTGITTGIDFSNNIYYKSDFANNWYWKGSDASSLNEWRSISQLDNASLDVNPLFIDPVNYDFHLGVGSPAINNGVYVGLTTDIDNQAIIGNPDIGAYEDQGPDFLPTSMSAIRSGGNRVYVLDAVFNQGGNSLNSIVINYYLSTDNKFSNDDLQLLCSKTQEILSSGQTSSLIRTTCYKPSNVMRSVNYNVLVMDDASNNVVENNEINNVGVAGVVSW